MRYGIFADVHSNLEALGAIIHAYKEEAIDKYLCAGDVVGYGANPKECVEQVKMLTMVTVAGNHDWASVNLFATNNFNPFAREAIFWTKQNLDDQSRYFLASLQLSYKNEDLTLVHGTLNNPGEFNYMTDSAVHETYKLLETKVCFIGHSHVARVIVTDKYDCIFYHDLFHRKADTASMDLNLDSEENDKYIINVGSVGQPRDGNPQAAYCIYDTDTRIVQIKRIDYDIQAARKKIIARGLPGFLGDRLLVGR